MSDADEEIDRGWFTTGRPARASAEPGSFPPDAAPPHLSQEEFDRLRDRMDAFQREVSASVDPRRRAALCHEVGRILELELRDERRAVYHYQRAYRYDPTHLPTLRAGRRLFARAGKWGMVARLIDAEARTRALPADRARLLREKGDIYHTRFGRVAEARACYRAAISLVDDGEAARRLADLATLDADPDGRADAALGAARRCPDPELRRALEVEAAEALLRAGRGDEAIALLHAEIDAGATEVDERLRAVLARALRDAGDWSRWLALAEREAADAPGPEAQARELIRLAGVAEDDLHDAQRAEGLLERAVQLDPEAADAWESLARLRMDAGRWAAAAQALDALSRRAQSPLARVDLLWRLAQLCLDHLDDMDGALAALDRLLELEPRWVPALEQIGRLLRQRGDWDGLVVILARERDATDDPRQRASLCFRLGELHELHRQDWVAAADAFRKATELDPGFLYAARALARMLLRLGDWPAYVALLEEEVDRAADDEARIYTLERIAEVWTVHLDEPARAIEAWRRVLDLRPDHLDAIRTVARLYARQRRWTELLSMNEREMGLTRDEGKLLSLLMRSAEISERELGEAERADGYVQRALTLDPRFLPALEARARYLRRAHAWRELVDLYERRIELAGSGEEAVGLHHEVGQIRFERLGDTEGAIRAYEGGLERVGDHLPTLRALRRLYAAAGDASREAELLAMEVEHVTDARRQAALLTRLGKVHLHRTGQPELAAEAWHRALAVDPRCREAMVALLDVHASSGDYEALAATHRRLANAADDPADALEHLLEVARICLEELHSVIEAIDACEQVLARAPGHLVALRILERLYLGAGEMGELARVLGAQAERVRAPTVRAELHARRARILAEHLEDLEGAEAAWRAVQAAEPRRRDALEWLEARALATDDVDLLASVLSPRLDEAEGPRDREAVLQQAGRLLRAAGQLSEAARCYEAALEVDAESPVALRALREIYVALGQEADAVRVAEAEGRFARDPTNAATLLVEAGSTREADRAGAVEALADYLEALARNPRDQSAAEAARRLAARTGRWEELVGALRRQADAWPERRAALQIEVAEISAGRLRRPADALAALRQVVAEPPDDPSLLQRTADLLAELEAWPEAADVYERLRAIPPDTALRRAVLFRLAALYADKLDNPGSARHCLNEVLETAPDDADALVRLARLDEEEDDFDAAIRLLERAADAVDTPEQRPALLRRLAALETSRGHHPAALAALERALADAPLDVELLEAMATAAVQAGEPARLRAAYDEALSHVTDETQHWRLRRDRVVRALEAGANAESMTGELAAVAEHFPNDRAVLEAHAAERVGAGDARAAVDDYRRLVSTQPFVIGHLRTLQRLTERDRDFDRAYELACLLNALGAGGESDGRLIREWRAHVGRWPDRPLDDVDLRPLWSTTYAPFADVLGAISRAVPELVAPPPTRTEAAPDELTALAERVAGCLGAVPSPLLLDERPPGQVVPTADGLVFGDALLRMSHGEQAFLLASGFALHQRDLTVVTRWAPTALRGLLEALVCAAGHPVQPRALGRETLDARATALHARLASALEGPLQAPMTELSRLLDALDVAAARADFLASAHRTALVLCGGIVPAVRALQKVAAGGERIVPSPERTPGVADLARWLVSAPYYDLRRSLGLAIDLEEDR